MAYDPVTIQSFKCFFTRDFPYGTTSDKVLDVDIQKALATAKVNFNESLWGSQDSFNTAFCYLAAHYLQVSIRASSGGLNGQYSGNVNSKSVGNVSESYSIPDRILANPFLAGLYTTQYGALYVQLLMPRLVGHVMTIQGNTTP